MRLVTLRTSTKAESASAHQKESEEDKNIMEPKSNHRANVVRIAEIKPIPDATNIGLVEIGGYQVVVRLADWKVGDLGVYIQPDSVVPVIPAFDFLWKDREFL